KDVTVWRKPSEEFNGFLYKAQGVVKDSPNRVVDYIRPGPYRLDWDSLMTSMDIVETFDEVSLRSSKGEWAPAGANAGRYTGQERHCGCCCCCVSIEYGETRQSFVRGFNHPCGWFCVPLEDNPGHSLLTGFIQTDLRGILPQSAVDSAMASTLANFYTDLRKALKV
ncbi:STAR4 protein, partial [Amia calva]|nr:STAR4 protein [Amia calva]